MPRGGTWSDKGNGKGKTRAPQPPKPRRVRQQWATPLMDPRTGMATKQHLGDADSSSGGEAKPFRDIFVGGLPRTWSSAPLESIARRFGHVIKAEVWYNGEGVQRGVGRICYSTESEALAALNGIDDAMVDGHRLRA